MIQRCENKNRDKYEHYGGRGISVCKEWHDSEKFIAWALSNGYDSDLTIDRIDVNGNYSPDNCRFITRKEQHKNMRCNRHVHSEYGDLILTEVALRAGICHTTATKWYSEDGFRNLDQFIAKERLIRNGRHPRKQQLDKLD
jgi:hypothetical protein